MKGTKTVFATLTLTALNAAPAIAATAALEQQFGEVVQPFVQQYCLGCHSGEKPASQFDISIYPTIEAVNADHPHWALVLGRLKAGDMPPAVLPQPPAEVRQQVIDWIEALRTEEAQRNAGDPGPVLARRLSNAEYNNTIRDLTGIDMQPTREFPVDPANLDGFDNSGETLTTSPSLLTKYLQAARAVTDQLVLNPDGIAFAPHPMLVETDREKYAIQRIVEFYKNQPTDFADYFEAAWRFKKDGQGSLESVAQKAGLSPKYLPMVWRILEGEVKADVGPIATLRGMWQAMPDDAAGVHAQAVQMRDFVVKIRKHSAKQFAAPKVEDLSPWSQPLINWKYAEFAASRREFDPASLRMESDPPVELPEIPPYPGLGRESAIRWEALMEHARAGDMDLVVPDGKRAEYEAAFADFSSVFPNEFYISERGRFFPDDSADKGRFLSAGYHNVMGYYRDDTALQELILDKAGVARLERLWDEFDFIADYTNRTWVQYFFNQSGEVQGNGRESGTERPTDRAVNAKSVIFDMRDTYLAKAQEQPENDPVAQQAIRVHYQSVNDTLRRVEKMRADAEPHHLEALEAFAARAYRRPLSKSERSGLISYYRQLRKENELTHEDAIRDSVVSILMSPDFLFRLDLVDGLSQNAAPTKGDRAPLSPYALASRLSYFLWASMPDEELLAKAASGELAKPEVLAAQARRMMKDERVYGLATEFGGNWLDFRRFETYNSVDRERFPAFDDELRVAMFEEPARLIEDAVRNDRSTLDLVFGDYTFVNPPLARHYGIPDVNGDERKWVRVDDADRYGRGGLLPMAVFLTQNAPGLRTSPVKRGYWVVKRVLGEEIPPPPATVPELPADEAKSELPLRDMLAKHRDNPACASCHARFDSFGLAFEGFGPVGEIRETDLAGRVADFAASFPDGSNREGVEGVRAYIAEHRQDDFLANLSRKLLGYALSRSVILSDEPLVEAAQQKLAANDFRFSALIETIITSPQFLNRRDAANIRSSAAEKPTGE